MAAPLAQQLEELLNPRPSLRDPEDDAEEGVRGLGGRFGTCGDAAGWDGPERAGAGRDGAARGASAGLGGVGVARGSGLGPGAAPRSPLCPAVCSGSGGGGRSSPCGPLPPERGGPQHAGLGRRHPAAPGGTSGSGHGITSGN